MSRHPDKVAVYADLERFAAPLAMGDLRCQEGRGGEVFSFAYRRSWLELPEAYAFDPDLTLTEGPQYPASTRTNFGIFLDSPPTSSASEFVSGY